MANYKHTERDITYCEPKTESGLPGHYSHLEGHLNPLIAEALSSGRKLRDLLHEKRAQRD